LHVSVICLYLANKILLLLLLLCFSEARKLCEMGLLTCALNMSFHAALAQWLKCNGTQGNAVPSPPIYGSKRPPPHIVIMLGKGTRPLSGAQTWMYSVPHL